VGLVLNPWHAAIEMQGPRIHEALNQGQSASEIQASLLERLSRFYLSSDHLIKRFYVGNSRPWEMRLPEMVQRGHFLDDHGIIPEMALIRLALQHQPTLVQAITLEAAPQSALLSGRLWVERSK
ncbi:MAG: hypothetical protein AAF485_25910, partial [Chloroflexota bacterium]